MIPVSVGVKVGLATDHTAMRKGFASLALLVQEVLKRDPLGGQVFCFANAIASGRSGCEGLSGNSMLGSANSAPVVPIGVGHQTDRLPAQALERFAIVLDDRCACSSNNAAERALRGFAQGTKVRLFAGSGRGAERAADMAALIPW